MQHGIWRKPGFWQVQLGVLRDVYHVTQGPDRRAVHLALCIAVINQGMASNSIMNYAPQLLQKTHGAGGHAVLWTSFITLAKVGALCSACLPLAAVMLAGITAMPGTVSTIAPFGGCLFAE